MVAAMPLSTESLDNKKTVTTNDLRNLALFLAGGLALLLVASQMVDSGSASATALEETSEKRYVPPFAVTTPTTSATEDVAYSSTIQWNDPDGTTVTLTCSSCLSWMSFQDNGDSTATITGTPLDAHVDARAPRHVVQHDRQLDGVGNLREVVEQPALRRLHVVRRDDERREAAVRQRVRILEVAEALRGGARRGGGGVAGHAL